MKLPDAMNFNAGAAIMLQGMTAHYLTHSTFPLKKGDRALVHAGAGGVDQFSLEQRLLRCRGLSQGAEQRSLAGAGRTEQEQAGFCHRSVVSRAIGDC